MTRLLEPLRTLRTAADLIDAGLATPSSAAGLADVAAAYATAITPALASLIDRADPNDPIARQFVPSRAELDIRPEELPDPIGDKTHEPVEGIVHRYPDRVLLKVVSVCPVYCRFCFRREMVGPDKNGNLSPAELEAALAYIRQHPEIWEVIVTGGDPFMLSTRRASALTRELEAIPHVKIIRWHTRMPVADPDRIADDFVEAIRSTKAVYVAIHCNHARELTPAARAACTRMTDAGIVLLSQSVLLAGVNDDIETLADLMRALVEIPHQALLSAPRRPSSRYIPLPHQHRARAGPRPPAPRPHLRPRPAALRRRHPRRRLQGARFPRRCRNRIRRRPPARPRRTLA